MMPPPSLQARQKLLLLLIVILILSTCAVACTENTTTPVIIASQTQTTHHPSPTNTVKTRPPLIPAATATWEPTPSSHVDDDMALCKEPVDDYTIVNINGHKLNQRTYMMLIYAASIYEGPINILDQAITQGSYTNAVEASFGTHAGGGAVDISVMAEGTYDILEEEISPLIFALRVAGFAAWYRKLNDLYDGSPAHIHVIAIGDRELSLAAREQLAGPFGYFWGYDGLPREDGYAIRDTHGGPIVCPWMTEMGYPAKTTTPRPGE
jgi:hypothetical protein